MKKTLLIRIGIGLLVILVLFGVLLLLSGDEEELTRDSEEVDVEISDEENDISEREREEALRPFDETQDRQPQEEEEDLRRIEQEEDKEREEIRTDNGITYQRKDEKTFVYEGEGSGEFGIRVPEEGGFLLYAEGNSAEEHFTITGKQALPTYYGGGSVTQLFVNTFREYEGVLLDREGRTNKLEIVAEGPWRVEVRSLSLAEPLRVSQEVSGRRDKVLSVEEGVSTLTVTGNMEEERAEYFEVSAYNGRKEILVDTDSAYKETLNLPEETSFLQILARGKWEVEAK